MKIFSSSQSGAARTQAALMTQTVFRRYLDVSLASSRRPTGHEAVFRRYLDVSLSSSTDHRVAG